MVDINLRCEKTVDGITFLMGLDKFPQNNSNTGVLPFRDNSLQIPSVHLGMIPFSKHNSSDVAVRSFSSTWERATNMILEAS
jgi:hypothetical protein